MRASLQTHLVRLVIIGAIGCCSPVAGAEIDDLFKQLASADRSTRLEAARKLTGVEKLPKSAVKPIVEFAKSELSTAVIPKLEWKKREVAKSIPIVGDETSLVRVKANPAQYVDKPFVLCGELAVSTYYNLGYRDSEKTHYSLRFGPLTKTAERDGNEFAYVYVPRVGGAGLVEQLVQREEAGFTGAVVRIQVQINSSYVRDASDLVNATEMLELIDWQFLAEDRKSWAPGHSRDPELHRLYFGR